MSLSEETLEGMSKKIESILIKILREECVEFDGIEVRIYDHVKTVGVMGDRRTYEHPVEITIIKKGGGGVDNTTLSKISVSIPNEVEGINRVLYTIYPLSLKEE